MFMRSVFLLLFFFLRIASAWFFSGGNKGKTTPNPQKHLASLNIDDIQALITKVDGVIDDNDLGNDQESKSPSCPDEDAFRRQLNAIDSAFDPLEQVMHILARETQETQELIASYAEVFKKRDLKRIDLEKKKSLLSDSLVSLKEMTKKLEKENQSKASLMQTIHQLEEEHEKAGEKVVRLEKELQKENDELSDKTKRLKDNRQILVSLKDALRGLEEKEQERNKLSASYETDKQRLSKRKKDLTANLSEKQAIINRDKKSLDSVEMNIKMRDDRLQRLDSLMIGGDIDENLKQSENDLKRLTHELEVLQKRLKSKGNASSEQDEIDDIDFLENLNHNHEIEVKKQEITLAQGNKDFLFKLKDRDPAKVREKLLTKYGNLESERDTIKTKLVSMEDEYRAMNLESTEVIDELEALENQQRNTKQNYVAIKVEKDELVRKVEGKEKSVNNSVEDVATKEAEVNTKRKQLEDYKASIIGREELIAKHKALEALETELLSIRTELSTNYLSQQSLLADFEMSKHWMVELNNELKDYEVRVKDRCNAQHKTKKDILDKLEEIGKKLLAVVASEQMTIKEEL